MKRKNETSRSLLTWFCIALVLIVFGMAMALWAFTQFSHIVLEVQNDSLREETTAVLNRMGLWLIIFGAILAAGVLLLAGLLLFTRWKDERALVILRKKNEQMEELNQKMQRLAHLQRLQTIGTLTSSIAHEFNNLLAPIMGYSMMTLEILPPEGEVYDNLLEIYEASRKAKTIISRLSDLSRNNTGRSYQHVSAGDVCRKVLEMAAPARPPKVEARLDNNSVGLFLYGNETQLSQLLLNLVLNAFHAMEEEGGVLTLATFSLGERIYFRVTDTGTGIPPEVLPRVFDPFFTTRKEGKGTGLGLPIVRQIAEEHGGTVQIESSVGRGSSVTVTLPLCCGPEEA